jgi:hypothetical protein
MKNSRFSAFENQVGSVFSIYQYSNMKVEFYRLLPFLPELEKFHTQTWVKHDQQNIWVSYGMKGFESALPATSYRCSVEPLLYPCLDHIHQGLSLKNSHIASMLVIPVRSLVAKPIKLIRPPMQKIFATVSSCLHQDILDTPHFRNIWNSLPHASHFLS